MALNIVTGVKHTPPKVLLYGNAGSGKTTLSSTFQKPLILDIEGGAGYVDAPRIPQKSLLTYPKVVNVLKTLIVQAARGKEGRQFDNIIIDSVDWLLRLIIEHGTGTRDKDGKIINLQATLNDDWSKPRLYVENYVRAELLELFNKLIACGYGLILIAHAEKGELLDGDGTRAAIVRPGIDGASSKKKEYQLGNVFVEWADFVLYLKNIDGQRTLLLESDGVALAKNRIGKHGSVSLSDPDFDINKLITKGA